MILVKCYPSPVFCLSPDAACTFPVLNSLRHAESQGNVDERIYTETPDWKVPLVSIPTPKEPTPDPPLPPLSPPFVP